MCTVQCAVVHSLPPADPYTSMQRQQKKNKTHIKKSSLYIHKHNTTKIDQFCTYIYLLHFLYFIAREKKKRGVEERMPSLLSNNSISGVWPPHALQGRKLPAPPLTGTLPRDDRHFVHCVKYKCDFMVVFNLCFSSSNFMFSQFF